MITVNHMRGKVVIFNRRLITCKQSKAVTTIFGDLLWHASSKGWKYFSATIMVELSLGNGSAEDVSSDGPPCLISFWISSEISHTLLSNTYTVRRYLSKLLRIKKNLTEYRRVVSKFVMNVLNLLTKRSFADFFQLGMIRLFDVFITKNFFQCTYDEHFFGTIFSHFTKFQSLYFRETKGKCIAKSKLAKFFKFSITF